MVLWDLVKKNGVKVVEIISMEFCVCSYPVFPSEKYKHPKKVAMQLRM